MPSTANSPAESDKILWLSRSIAAASAAGLPPVFSVSPESLFEFTPPESFVPESLFAFTESVSFISVFPESVSFDSCPKVSVCRANCLESSHSSPVESPNKNKKSPTIPTIRKLTPYRIHFISILSYSCAFSCNFSNNSSNSIVKSINSYSPA